MTRREKVLSAVAIVAIAAAALPWAIPLGKRIAFPPEASAAERGHIVAEANGCFGCHGPEGTGGVLNPESRHGVVPPLVDDEDDAEEITQWIRDGHPPRRNPAPAPVEETGKPKKLLTMPAYGKVLSDAQIADLVAMIQTWAPLDPKLDAHVAHGIELAKANACFACHGALGSGGRKDPGSLKGYIPGWYGKDLSELARNDAEIEEWIRRGNVNRLLSNPAAKHYLDAELIKMPDYGNRLSAEEIADLVQLVKWAHQRGD